MDTTLQIILCILISDFITGLFHWFEDTYGTISDSWISKYIWQPNISHHKNPSDITNNTFINRNIIQFIIVGIFISISLFFGFFCWQLCLVGILTGLSNEIHCWTHNKTNNWLVQLLQDSCILQTKLHHSKHHLSPYTKNYCILTNWLNPALEKVKFWSRLESIFSLFISIKRGSDNRMGF